MPDSEQFANMHPRLTGFGNLKIDITLIDFATVQVGAVSDKFRTGKNPPKTGTAETLQE